MEFSDVWNINFKKAATKKISINPAEAEEMIEGFGQCTRCGGTGKVDPRGPANGPVCPACRKLPIPGEATKKKEDAEVAADWIDIDTSGNWPMLQKFTPTYCTVCGIEGNEESAYKPVAPHLKSIEIKLRDMVHQMTGDRKLRQKHLHKIHNILADAGEEDKPE